MKRYIKSSSTTEFTQEVRIRLFGDNPRGEVTIPPEYTVIGDHAFYHCSRVTSVIMSNSIQSIQEYAFYGCSQLVKVVMSNAIDCIPRYAFFGCDNLRYIDLPSSIQEIGPYAFGQSGLMKVVIPASVKHVGDSAFISCQNLSRVTVENSKTKIHYLAFEYCNVTTWDGKGQIVKEPGGIMESTQVSSSSVPSSNMMKYFMKICDAAWGEDALGPALSVLSLKTGRVEGFDLYGDYADVSFLGNLRSLVSGLISVYKEAGLKIIENHNNYFCYDNEGTVVKVFVEQSDEASTYSEKSTGFFVSVENIEGY